MNVLSTRFVSASLSVVLLWSAPAFAAAGDGWMPIHTHPDGRSESAVRFVRFVQGPVTFTGLAFRTPLSGPSVCLRSVGFLNPSWDRVEAIRLSWSLYAESDLDTPVASGVTPLVTLTKPLWFKDSTTLMLDTVFDGFVEGTTYRLEIRADTILYKGLPSWHRPPPTVPSAPATPLTTQPN